MRLSRKVIDRFFQNYKNFSDHKPTETIIESSKTENLSVTKSTMHAFERTNWENLNECIEHELFFYLFAKAMLTNFCSNGTNGYGKKLTKNCLRITKHRANLVTWISGFT